MEFFRRNQLHIISLHLILLFIIILGTYTYINICRFTYDVVGILIYYIMSVDHVDFLRDPSPERSCVYTIFQSIFLYAQIIQLWLCILLYTNRFATYAYIMVHNIICGHSRWERGVLYTRCSHPRYREIGLAMQWNLAWMGRFSS